MPLFSLSLSDFKISSLVLNSISIMRLVGFPLYLFCLVVHIASWIFLNIIDHFHIFLSLGTVSVSLFVLFFWDSNYIYVRPFCSISYAPNTFPLSSCLSTHHSRYFLLRYLSVYKLFNQLYLICFKPIHWIFNFHYSIFLS